MKAVIVVSLVGVFALDKEGQVISKILFKRNPRLIAEKLESFDSGKETIEVVSLVRKLKKKGYTTLVFENASVAKNLKERFAIETSFVHPSQQGENFRRDMEILATEVGFVKQKQELRDLIRDVSIELTRLRVQKAGAKRDLMISQAVLSIDDINKTTNLFMGRVREWYGLHFPELDQFLEKHETYSRFVMTFGKRSNFTVESLEEEGLSKEKAARIAQSAETSMGAELSSTDIKQIQSLCKLVLELYNLRQILQKYASSTVEKVAPNTQALVGSLLAARLITLAGGLINLAKMPASTIQVLGAEKALFRALKTGTRPPKHGIIYQDALIHGSKKWQRGKMSRALAGKLAIAARTDAFSNRFIGDSLKAELERRIAEIKEKYHKPPLVGEHKKKKLQSIRKKRRKRRGRKR